MPGLLLYVVKCNLMELTTKSGCVPSTVCGMVLYTHHCIYLYVNVPSCPTVFCEALTLVHAAELCPPLLFCVVCSCTCASTCAEPVLVSLCHQRSYAVHMRVDPSCPRVCCCSIVRSSIVFGLFPPYPPLAFFLDTVRSL